MNFTLGMLLIVVFLLCILLLTSSGIGIKFYNDYNDFLKSRQTGDQYNAWEKSNKMTKDYLWGAIGTGSIILFGLIIFLIVMLRYNKKSGSYDLKEFTELNKTLTELNKKMSMEKIMAST
jgi:hypothetical protein